MAPTLPPSMDFCENLLILSHFIKGQTFSFKVIHKYSESSLIIIIITKDTLTLGCQNAL